MLGPGKYDKNAKDIIEQSGAQAVILVVMGDREGASGLSIKVSDNHLEVLRRLPQILRHTAALIEKDNLSEKDADVVSAAKRGTN
jgi:hypothetical protein